MGNMKGKEIDHQEIKQSVRGFFLMILWPSTRYLESQLLDALEGLSFESVEVDWGSGESYMNSIGRFYGEDRTNIESKARCCGEGNPLVFVVDGGASDMGLRLTSRGHTYVNTTAFDLKSELRQLDNGSSNIHATNDESEFIRDFSLIFESEVSKITFAAGSLKVRDGLLGMGEWASIVELLDAIQLISNYVVLRNFDDFPDKLSDDKHADVDLLVDDFDAVLSMVGGISPKIERGRVNVIVNIAGERVNLDVRSVGDNYYPDQWSRDVLGRRQFNGWGFIPSDDDYSFLLLYHALIHKKTLSADYALKLSSLFDIPIGIGFINELEIKLREYVEANELELKACSDKTVFFNSLSRPCDYWENAVVRSIYENEIVPCLRTRSTGSGYNYYHVIVDQVPKYFVKFGGVGGSAKREFDAVTHIQKNFSKSNAGMVPNVDTYLSDGRKKFVAHEIVEGVSLKDLILIGNLDSAKLADIFYKTLDFIEEMIERKMVHRDLTPDNIIISSNGSVLISDWQFCVSKNKKFRENHQVKKQVEIISNLGGRYYPGRYKWDDAKACKLMILELEKNFEGNDLKALLDKASLLTGKCVYRRRVFEVRFHLGKLRKSLIKKLKKLKL